MNTNLRHLFFLSAFVLFFGILSGCGTDELKSRWRDRTITVDGNDQEWSNTLSGLEEKGTFVGVMNDATDLYLILTTANSDLQRQIAFGGVTLWFDRDGGKKKLFGIHYPLPGRRGFRRTPEDQGGENGGTESMLRELPVDSTGDLEIDGPGDQDRHRMTRAEAAGIDVQYRMNRDTLIYEIKVPLTESGNRPFAIGTRPGRVIGVGFETGMRNRPPRSEGEGTEPGEGEGGRGGYGGRFGGRGGGFGGRGGEGRRGGNRFEGEAGTVDVWTMLTLASEEPAQH